MSTVSEKSWLADGVAEIERVVKSGIVVTPQIFDLPKEKRGTYAFVTAGPATMLLKDKIDIRLAGPKWHNEVLADPNQLVDFIKSMGDRGVKPEAGVVYIDPFAATYVYDFEDRRNRATCPLIISKPWAWLAAIQPPLDQKTIVRTLRILFDGCLASDSNLINVLRTVKWKQDGSVDSNVQRGKEGLGRQILNEVAGITDFPEHFTLQLSVYENYRADQSVRVALEILPDMQRFEVIPFPNQIYRGQAETLTRLQALIADTGVPTFIGSVEAAKE